MYYRNKLIKYTDCWYPSNRLWPGDWCMLEVYFQFASLLHVPFCRYTKQGKKIPSQASYSKRKVSHMYSGTHSTEKENSKTHKAFSYRKKL